MTAAKPRNPSTVKHADHEIITPDHQTLHQAVVPATGNEEDPVTRAEKALNQLSGQFGNWMNEECERLDAVRRDVKANGLDKKTREVLYRAAGDVKGNALTLGYREVAPVADSLCRLLEHTPDMTRISLELIDQHVDAIRAIVREHDRSDISGIASVLASRLRQVTEEFLVAENQHRPDYLRAIASPPLSPGDQF